MEFAMSITKNKVASYRIKDGRRVSLVEKKIIMSGVNGKGNSPF
jgi:hypothetical protein